MQNEYNIEVYIYNSNTKTETKINEYFGNETSEEAWFKGVEADILSEIYQKKIKFI